MDDGELRAEIGTAIRTFIAGVVIHNTAVAQKLGLGASDGQFMTLLANHGSLTAGELARLSGLATGTVTGVIDRLERGGFVRRERDGSDRRKVVVVLVPEAAARTYEHYRAYGEQVDRILGSRSTTELQTIAAFFAEVTDTDPLSR